MPNRSFHRKRGESPKAYEAFRLYLDMGPNRTLEAVSKKLGKSDTLIQRWSGRWKWKRRVEDYVDWMFNQVDAERRERIVSSDETLEELSRIVRGNPDNGTKLKYADKLKAIELAGKHHGLWNDGVVVNFDEILAFYSGYPQTLLPARLEPDPNADAVDAEILPAEGNQG